MLNSHSITEDKYNWYKGPLLHSSHRFIGQILDRKWSSSTSTLVQNPVQISVHESSPQSSFYSLVPRPHPPFNVTRSGCGLGTRPATAFTLTRQSTLAGAGPGGALGSGGGARHETRGRHGYDCACACVHLCRYRRGRGYPIAQLRL